MAEVVITKSWEGKIEKIDRYLSKVRKRFLKRYFEMWRKMVKNPGGVSPSDIETLYEILEHLKYFDQALNGRFNIIIVVPGERWGTWII